MKHVMNFISEWFIEIIMILCFSSIIYAEYLFLTGDVIHALFVAIWVPTILGIYNAISNKELKNKIKYLNKGKGKSGKLVIGEDEEKE